MQSFTMDVGGRPLTIEQGKMAKQANGAVLVRYGDTVVLVTATASTSPREGVDFFPLTVDYEEKMYAVGKIPGGFIKREGRPANEAILCARLIDRPIRPLFPKGFRNDVEVMATVLSVEQDNPPEIAAMIGASCALSVSDIPWAGPIAGVRVGRVDGQFIINPTVEQREKSELNLTIAGSHDAVMMVEAGAKELPEDVILEAILFGHEEIKKIVEFQQGIISQCGKEKREMKLFAPPEALLQGIKEYAEARLDAAVRNPDKLNRDENIAAINAETMEHFLAEYPDCAKEIAGILHDLEKDIVRRMITLEKIRPDGRALDEVRPVSCEVGLLPRTHGSALFTRGQTQILTVTTLGSLGDEQVIDGLGTEKSKRYIHQYNFPGYSVGEARPARGPGRREIGHGALAERALLPVIPSEEEFPYTLRLVSEVLESNGSSSMGSVCGSTMSLMHAGVPIKRPVSGVAMGLVKVGDNYTILTDIQGMEDALGDMDFKVAGTEQGITAIQMDIKIAGKRGAFPVRAEGHDDAHQRGQDPERHRTGRQDHQEDCRGYEHADRHRGRRHGAYFRCQRGGLAEGHRDHQGADPRRGGGRDVSRPRDAHHGLRRFRRGAAGQGRALPYLPAFETARGESRGCGEGRRRDRREGHGDRPPGPRQCFAQGAFGLRFEQLLGRGTAVSRPVC